LSAWSQGVPVNHSGKKSRHSAAELAIPLYPAGLSGRADIAKLFWLVGLFALPFQNLSFSGTFLAGNGQV
jgi:hypothetical protein